jgi:hypothetical protein
LIGGIAISPRSPLAFEVIGGVGTTLLADQLEQIQMLSLVNRGPLLRTSWLFAFRLSGLIRRRHDEVDALAPCGQRCRGRRGAHDRPCPYRWHDGLKAAVGVGGKIMDGLGLGWIVSLAKGKRPLILAKSGGIAGFMTYVVLAPTRGVGVFVAVNRLNFLFEGLTSGVRELVADLAPR